MSRWERNVGWRSPTNMIEDGENGHLRSEGKRKGSLCAACRSANKHESLEALPLSKA
ncbi:hypothetical protein M493_04480 [Geobacillus genomosp. 3]|uniref:Uncharacterized protein n=1 Tax=Geobacillus genomosp. 3 TaxID=1921421 RepID=S6A0K8_GEOG3|nr:hypothetical protein M493_04480 [Geobacillus genomosp. 3]